MRGLEVAGAVIDAEFAVNIDFARIHDVLVLQLSPLAKLNVWFLRQLTCDAD